MAARQSEGRKAPNMRSDYFVMQASRARRLLTGAKPKVCNMPRCIVSSSSIKASQQQDCTQQPKLPSMVDSTAAAGLFGLQKPCSSGIGIIYPGSLFVGSAGEDSVPNSSGRKRRTPGKRSSRRVAQRSGRSVRFRSRRPALRRRGAGCPRIWQQSTRSSRRSARTGPK